MKPDSPFAIPRQPLALGFAGVLAVGSLLWAATAKAPPPSPIAAPDRAVASAVEQSTRLLAANQESLSRFAEKLDALERTADENQAKLTELAQAVEDQSAKSNQPSPDAVKTQNLILYLHSRLDRVESLLKQLDATLSTPQLVHQLLEKQTNLAAQKPPAK